MFVRENGEKNFFWEFADDVVFHKLGKIRGDELSTRGNVAGPFKGLEELLHDGIHGM